MLDFLVAIGLILVIEGLLLAAMPSLTKQALAQVLETPDSVLRAVGIVSAGIGLAAVWLLRSMG